MHMRNLTTTDGIAKFLVIEETCMSENWPIWCGINTGYNRLILAVTVAVALLTYRIPNPSFSTQALCVLIFLFTIVTVTGPSIIYLLYLNSTCPTLLTWFIEIITFNLLLALSIYRIAHNSIYIKTERADMMLLFFWEKKDEM